MKSRLKTHEGEHETHPQAAHPQLEAHAVYPGAALAVVVIHFSLSVIFTSAQTVSSRGEDVSADVVGFRVEVVVSREVECLLLAEVLDLPDLDGDGSEGRRCRG